MSKGDFINGKNTDGKKQSETPEQNGENQEKNYTFFFIALAGFVAGALCFGLAFAIKGAGTYLLFASMFCELGCATFLNAQKKRYKFIWIMVLRVASYIIMAAAIIIVIAGTIVSQNAHAMNI